MFLSEFEMENINIMGWKILLYKVETFNIRQEEVSTLSQHWNIASHALREEDLDPVMSRQSTLSCVFSLSETSSRSWKDCTYFAIFIILT